MLFRLVVLACVALCCSATAYAAPPPLPEGLLDRPAFSIPVAELQKLSSPSAPVGLDVEVLVEDTVYRFDDLGRRSVTYHLIYRVLTERGAETWGSIRAGYRPWYEEKPELRVRVISPKGAVAELNPATLVDALASQNDDNVYSDAHVISGPLPAVSAGSIVESIIVTREHKKFFDSGMLYRETFYANTYTALARIRIDSPSKLAVAIKPRQKALKPAVAKAGDRTLTSFVMRDLLPLSEAPAPSDPDIAVYPEVEISTGKSWDEVARTYGKMVDAQLAGFDPKPILAAVLGNSDDQATKVNKLLAYVHREVRYTGLELGDRSIVPFKPSETLERKYGDCKDKSTLLVGLLRGAGVEAHLALLDTGPGRDVPKDLAGFGLFNHAIVRVGGKTPLWIDATDPYSPAGELPYGDQDRLALLAGDKSPKLLRTPRTTPEASGYVEDVFIDFAENGNARVREVTTGRGTVLSAMRGDYDRTPDQLKERFKGYVTKRYGGQLSRAAANHALDLTQAFSLEIEASDAERYQTVTDGGFAEIGPSGLYGYLNEALYETSESEISEKEKAAEQRAKDPRYRDPEQRLPVYVSHAHKNAHRYHLSLPEGFAWHGVPDSFERTAAGITVSRTVMQKDPRSLSVSYEVRAEPRVIPREQLDSVRKALNEFYDQAGARVRFVYEPQQATERHDVTVAMRLHRELLKKYPKSVHVASRYAQDLLRMGFGLEARKVADQLVKDHPQVAHAHWTQGYVYLFDEMGRDSHPGWDVARAEKALREALRLDPEEELHYRALAAVLNTQAWSEPKLNMARVAELGSLFERIATKFDDHSNDLDLLRALVWQKKHDEAEKVAGRLEADEPRNGLWVATIASMRDAASAKRKAEQLVGGDPKRLLAVAMFTLVIYGQYDKAIELGKLPLLAPETTAIIKLLEGIGRRDACLKELHPATRAVLDFVGPYLKQTDPGLVLYRDLKKKKAESVDSYSLVASARALVQQHTLFKERQDARVGEMLTLALPCAVRAEVKEEEGAVQVTMHRSGAPNRDDSPTFYLRKSGASFAVIGRKLEHRTVVFSRAMLLALADKRVPEARVWAGWAKEHTKRSGGNTQRYTGADAAKALMPVDLGKASADELATLAAVYGLGDGIAIRDPKLLDAAVKRVSGDEPKRALTYARAWAHFSKNPALSADLLKPQHEAHPDDLELWKFYLRSLYVAKRNAELTAELVKLEAAHPTEEAIASFRGSLELREGRYGDTIARTRERMQSNKASKSELNNASWNALFTNTGMKDAVEIAQAACEPEGEASSSALHTLATLLVENGDPDKAHKHLMTAIEKEGGRDYWQVAWYPLGRIAEVLGLDGQAKAAYQRMEAPEGFHEATTYDLVVRRLAQLKK